MQVKRHKKLFFRVFGIFGLFVLAVVLFMAFMVIPLQKKSLQDIMLAQAVSVSRSVIQACSDAMINGDFGFIVEHNLKVLKNNAGIHYVLISPQRGQQILIKPSGWMVKDHIDPLFKRLEIGKSSFIFIENQLSPHKVFHFSYAINFSGIKWGWIHIGFSTEKYDQNIEDMNLNIIYIIGIAILLILVFGYFFARWITRPVLTLGQLANEVATGNLNVKADLQRNDEMGDLFKRFNQMVLALKKSNESLENYNQQLELEVGKRTRELDELNKNLDYRVKSEITRRREQEQLLIYQSRLAAIGEMVGAIAHQWRQPLNALGLVLQNLQLIYQQDTLDDATMSRSMEKSERLVHKMSSTIDDFRNFFKPNKQAEIFNLQRAVQSVAELLEASLKNDGITLIVKGEKSIEVMGYQGEFSQVILNLISNAKDALLANKPEFPKIAIVVNEKNNTICIEIIDNGGGIEAQNVYKIFDPYFTTKQESQGIGIGLYMSKMIVEKSMGGELYVENNGSGATFRILLMKK